MASYQDRNGNRTMTVRMQKKGQPRFIESRTLPLTTRNIKALNEWAADLEERLKKDGIEAVRRYTSVTSLADVLKSYIAEYSKTANKWALNHLNYLVESQTKLSEINIHTIKASDLIDYAKNRKSTGTKNNGRHVAKGVIHTDFSYLINAIKTMNVTRNLNINLDVFEEARHILKRENILGISAKRMRRPTIQELENIVSHFITMREIYSKTTIIPMDDIVLFALFSGRRQAEITRLKWENLDEQQKTVVVEKMKHPTKKESNDKTVYLTDEALAIIKRQPQISEYIFPYEAKTLSVKFNKICKKLKIENLKFHDLRHEFCSWCAERKIDVLTIMLMSGHESLSNLQRYVHLQKRDYYDKYEKWKWRPKA
jgi:integrase